MHPLPHSLLIEHKARIKIPYIRHNNQCPVESNDFSSNHSYKRGNVRWHRLSTAKNVIPSQHTELVVFTQMVWNATIGINNHMKIVAFILSDVKISLLCDAFHSWKINSRLKTAISNEHSDILSNNLCQGTEPLTWNYFNKIFITTGY
mgnify:CR=1 FL=1